MSQNEGEGVANADRTDKGGKGGGWGNADND